MDKEICKHCNKVIATDCTSSGFYCSQLREEDQEWIESIQHQPASPAGCHYIAQKFCITNNKKPPLKCEYYLEHIMSEGEYDTAF